MTYGKVRACFFQKLSVMSKKHCYKVIFANQGKVFEIYAKSVCQSDIFGFVEVEELLFGEKTTVVVDPSEESLKSEFDGVARTYLPTHSILRIDQVAKKGQAKITDSKGTDSSVTPFPVFTPTNK